MATKTKMILSKNLVTVPVGTTLLEARYLMAEKKIYHLPVVDISQNVVGILSQRDTMAIKYPEQIKVQSVMCPHVLSVSEENSLQEAIGLILKNKVSAVLITDYNDHATGIITTEDLLSYLSQRLDKDPEQEEVSPFEGLLNLRTVGEVAQQLSNVGI